MTQAFDFVDMEILVNKLDCYSIHVSGLRPILSFLTNKTQVTEISSLNYGSKYKVTDTHLIYDQYIRYIWCEAECWVSFY